MDLWSCPKLRHGGWDFVPGHQPVNGCGPPLGRGDRFNLEQPTLPAAGGVTLVLSSPLCPTPLTSGNLGGHPDSSGLLQDATGLKLYSHGFLELDLMQPVRETLLSCEVYSHIFYSKKFFLLIITSWLSSFYLLNYMGVICETLI